MLVPICEWIPPSDKVLDCFTYRAIVAASLDAKGDVVEKPNRLKCPLVGRLSRNPIFVFASTASLIFSIR